jgi:hypothetical protein
LVPLAIGFKLNPNGSEPVPHHGDLVAGGDDIAVKALNFRRDVGMQTVANLRQLAHASLFRVGNQSYHPEPDTTVTIT